jgi:hypothetical protein
MKLTRCIRVNYVNPWECPFDQPIVPP